LNRKDFTDDVASRVPWESLTTLTNIDFRNCSLTSIPIGIAKLDPQTLKSLRLEGNPLVGFHRSLVDTKTLPEGIIFNLRESLKGGNVIFNEMKVMVVGEPAVGKTTMLKILYGNTSRDVAARPCVATDGIDLGEISLDGYRLMFWDFAGQEVYRYTHQLFISDNALCLVMFRLITVEDEAQRQLTYWMDSLLQRAPNASCVVIGTCASDLGGDKAEVRLRSYFEFCRKRYGERVRGAVAIDSLHDYGFGTLKKELVRVTKQNVSIFVVMFDIEEREM